MTSSCKAAVSSNTDPGLGGDGSVSVCVCACARVNFVCAGCDMLQSRPQGSNEEIQSAQLHRPS